MNGFPSASVLSAERGGSEEVCPGVPVPGAEGGAAVPGPEDPR